MNTQKTLALITGITLVGACAQLQRFMSTEQQEMQARTQLQQMDQMQLQDIDINGDGIISQAEVEAYDRVTSRMRENWDNADVDNDGNVGVAEFAAFRDQVMDEYQEEQLTGTSPEEEEDVLYSGDD